MPARRPRRWHPRWSCGAALHCTGSPKPPWFTAEARRLESLRVDALEEQFEAALALGDHREIVPALRVALDENPFRERLWGQLMLALYRSGRQPDALEAFHEARRVLSENSRSSPAPTCVDSRGDPRARSSNRPRRGGAEAPWNLPAPATSFVGRDERSPTSSSCCASTAS